MKNELETYRYLIEQSRRLVLFYLKRLDAANVDPTQEFEVDGKVFNPLIWQIGHLAWAQNNLVIRASGGPNPEVKWLKYFSMGRPAAESRGIATYAEIREGFDKVHATALAHLETLTPESVGEESKLEFIPPGGSKELRSLLTHHVRHENTHVGQIAWLAKMYGVQTI